MDTDLKKQLIKRISALLITTVSIGLVYNVINPSGIPLRKVLNESVGPERAALEKAIPNLTASVYGHEMLSVSIIKADNEPTIKRPIVSSENSLPITWEKAKKLIEEDKAIFIDLRSDSEYQARHFPGAISIPVSSIKDSMVKFTEKYSSDRSLLIGCITQDCMSAIKAISTFVKANYRKVRVVYGDGKEWGADLVSSLSSLPKTHKRNVRGSYSNETITVSIIPVNRKVVARSGNYNITQVTWREVKPLLEHDEIVLVDGRSKKAFEAGHIPGAVSLPLANLSEEIDSFMSKFPSETPIIVYCGNRRCLIAQKLAHALINLYGYRSNVRVMPGGYLEWRQAEL